MTLTVSTASADKYSRAWKQVDKLMEEDLPESAAAEVNRIFDLAARDHDSKQMLKSAVYMTQVETMLGGDNLGGGIELLNGLLPKLGQKEYKAICHAFLAKGYQEYWSRNRWQMQRNLPSDRKDVPLPEWTTRMICDTIITHLTASIDMAGEARTEWFEDFFPGSNKDGLKLRPTLTDMLLDNAVIDISGQRLNKEKRRILFDKQIYGDGADFVQAVGDIDPTDTELWRLYVLGRMTKRNLVSKPQIRATVDIHRVRVLGTMINDFRTWNTCDSMLVDGMVRLGENYGKKVNFGALFMDEAAKRIVDRQWCMTDEQQERNLQMAHDICQRTIKVWPKSEGAFNCMSTLAGIEEKNVSLSLSGDLMAGGSNLAKVSYKNVKAVYLRAIEASGEFKNMDTREVLDQLTRCSVVAEWRITDTDKKDWMTHTSWVEIPPLMQGPYYILASSGSNFNSRDCISLAYTECSAITFMQAGGAQGSIEGFVINRRSGKAVPDVMYTLWQLNPNGSQVKIVTRGMADNDGYILIENLAGGSYSLEMEHGQDRGNSRVQASYVSDMPDRNTVRLYTDRFTYRQGDSIGFAALVYHTGGFSGGKVLAGTPVSVSLHDTSGKELDKIKALTDSMGMMTGKFLIPASSMPGSFRLRVVAGESGDEVRASHTVNVQSFTLSKFDIEFDAFDELRTYDREITVSGKVSTLTGVPVQNALVQWSAGADGGSLDIFRVRDRNGSVRVGEGECRTDAEGRFSLSLIVPENIIVDDEFDTYVSIPVRVTDLNGETRDRTASLSIGGKYRSLQAVVPAGIVGREGSRKVSVKLTDEGKAVNGTVNVKASALEWYEKPGLMLSGFENRSLASAEGRTARELKESAEKLGLAGKFPTYRLDSEIKPSETAVLVNSDVSCGHEENVLQVSVPRSGLYRLDMTSADAADYSAEYMWLLDSDREWVPQGVLVWGEPDRRQVAPGDTAVLRFGNAFPGSVMHYTVLTGMGSCMHGSIVSSGRQMTLSVPVTREMEGGFVVRVISMLDNLREEKTFQFDVPFTSHSLNVGVEKNDDVMAPVSAQNWKLNVTDGNGQPVAARLLLDMYDSALDCFGSNWWTFSPWSAPMPRIQYQYFNGRYSNEYNPAWYGGEAKPYSGKVAVTGTLLNPFQYSFGKSSVMKMTKGIAARSVVAMNESVAYASMPADGAMMDAVSVQNGMIEEESVLETGAADNYANEEKAVELRDDMNPTGLFISLDADSTGQAVVDFNAPELLTEWHVQGLAYNDSLKTGTFRFDVVTRKDLMIEPSAPRFLREGDCLEFTQKVMNATDRQIEAVLTLSLKNAVDGKPVNAIDGRTARKSVKAVIPASGSIQTVFTVNVPEGLTAVEYTMTAVSGELSDGVREVLPVLSSRTSVVEALSLYNNGKEKRSFRFEELARPASETMRDEHIVVEYSANPVWYAIQSLPTLIRVDDPSNIRLAHSILGAASTLEIVERNPQIKDMLREWEALPASEWQTQLERNQKLTGTLLGETPWEVGSDFERDRLRALAVAMDSGTVAVTLATALENLVKAQNPDGGWPWLEGFDSDIHVTDVILDCLGRLRENGAIKPDATLSRAIENAVAWLDAQFYKRYDVEKKPESLGISELSYLLTRSRFADISYMNRTNVSHSFYMVLAQNQDTHELDLTARAKLALVLADRNMERASHVTATMLERSVLEEEMGRYWRDNRSGYLWYEAPIEAQALAIEALLVTGRPDEAAECARWLLKQKQTTGWGSSSATAQAVVALLAAGGRTALTTVPDVTVTIGKTSIKASESKAMAGYVRKDIPGPSTPAMATVTVDSRTDLTGWGAVYRQYTERIDKVSESANGMTLQRTIWRVVSGASGDRLEEVTPGTMLRVGDRVRVQFNLSTDRALEYVQLKDMRAASFEPVSTSAGRRWGMGSGISYYAAPGNSCNDFYIDRMEKGSYRIEYDLYVQKPGIYQAGLAVMQCLYAPAFRATTKAQTVSVGNNE